ncbi:MAG: 50S ribosomal protein L10 [Solirubrobacterales bacterium]
MDRQEKEAVVAQLGEEISEVESIFAIDYRGISVSQSAELRGALREADASFRVVKNRLTKLAAKKAGVAELEAMLEGPTALTFVRGDTAMAAKAITTFNREYEVLTYKGGLMGDMVLDEDRFKEIAKLPSRDALNAQLAGIVASPIVTLTRGLGSMIQGLAIALSQVAEQGLVGGSAEAETPAEEPASDGAGDAPEEAADAEAEEAAGEPAAEEGGEGASEEATGESGGDGDGESDEASEPEAEAPAEDPAAEEGEGQEAEESEGDAGDGGDDEGEGDQDDSPAEDGGEE